MNICCGESFSKSTLKSTLVEKFQAWGIKSVENLYFLEIKSMFHILIIVEVVACNSLIDQYYNLASDFIW